VRLRYSGKVERGGAIEAWISYRSLSALARKITGNGVVGTALTPD
jgi:hypothetical protein